MVTSRVRKLSNCTREQRLSVGPQVKAKIARLWKAGIRHGDVAWRNIAILEGANDAVLLDLGLSECMDAEEARRMDNPWVERLGLGVDA
jgi:tRNA A-37 threonylcarbamoyl transferase component Bud32